jgi:hypothetical protein
MVARDDLHRLICQLSPAEVRYFKRHAFQHTRHDTHQSLVLFEAIAKLAVYNESALRSALGDIPMVRQLSVAKGYLHGLLLRVLGEFHSQKGIAAKLRSTLMQVEILFDKGLMEDAKRRVEKGYTLAMNHDQLNYALELLRWHIKLLKKSGRRDDFQELLQLQLEETYLLQDMVTESELRKAHDEILAAFSMGIDSAQQTVAHVVEAVLLRPVTGLSPASLRFNSCLILHYIHIHANQFRRNLQMASLHYQAMIDLWESHPHRIKEEMERYVITVIGHLQVSYQSLHYAAFEATLIKLRKLTLPHSALAAKAFHYSYLLELTYAIDTGNPPLSGDLEEQILKGLDEYRGLIDPSAALSFYSNLAIYHLFHGDFHHSLQWINLVYNSKDSTMRKDIRAFSICLRMVLQFELGDVDLVGYLLQSTRRNLQRQNDQHPLQTLMVRHLNRIIQKVENDQAGEWEFFFQQLSALAKESNEAFSGIKALLNWVESKVSGRTILEIVRGG